MNNIKKLRVEKNKTLREMADDLDVNYQVISRYEREEREPDIYMLNRLADYFNV